MNENICAVCHKPILGYWHEVEKNLVCQSCAAITTVYDMFMLDLIPIKPEIIEGNATLVTKEDEKIHFDTANEAVDNPNAQYNQLACSDFKLSEKRNEPDETPYKCGQCAYYYGEIDSCMYEEMQITDEVRHDIDTMSHDDFFSKYPDNPVALAEYVSRNG